MARLAEVGGTEAEPNRNRATPPAFELQEVSAVLVTDLRGTAGGASRADELACIKAVGRSRRGTAVTLSSKVRLVASEAGVVVVAMHRELGWLAVELATLVHDLIGLLFSLVPEAHLGFAAHLLLQCPYGLEKVGECRVVERRLAQRAVGEAEGDGRAVPPALEQTPQATVVEKVPAADFDRRRSSQIVGEANLAVVVRIGELQHGGAQTTARSNMIKLGRRD